MRLRLLCTVLVACIAHESRAQAQDATRMERRRLEEVLTIDDEGGSFFFARISNVMNGPDGRIYVFDTGECEVKVFSATGRLMKKFGRAGQGPGELACPGTFLRLRDTFIVASSIQSTRVSTFRLDGSLVDTKQPPGIPGDGPNDASTPLRYGFRLTTPKSMRSADSHKTVMIRRAGASRVDTIARIRRGDVVVQQGKVRTGGLPSGFGESGAYAHFGDSVVAVVDGYSGTVTWYLLRQTGLAVSRRASLGVTGRSVTARDIAEMETRFRKGSGTGYFATAKFIDVPTRWSVSEQAFFDPEGTLWVGGLYDVEKPVVWYAFPPTGAPFTVETPAGFSLLSARGDRLYGYSFKEDRTQVVRVFRTFKPGREAALAWRRPPKARPG
jgi:hypothetical protein